MLLGTKSIEKRNSIIGWIVVAVIALLYFFTRGFLPVLIGPDSQGLKSNYSLILTLATSLTLFIYLGIHSLYLCKKKLFLFSVIEFISAILFYIAGFLFLAHDGGYLGFFAWPYALGVLVLYTAVWTIFFAVQVVRHLYEKKSFVI